ncbi:MAG: hypothetical protein FWH14_05440 [Oscillospiraceae bacterium]|nr:hypothetical protein [Oscillospiraceae bacterium]
MANTRNKVAIVFDGVVCCGVPSQGRVFFPWLRRVFSPFVSFVYFVVEKTIIHSRQIETFFWTVFQYN